MSTLEIVVLALIQGLTEFLPISSSAHLILPSQLFGWQDQGLAFDVAVHAGTLIAVVGYFRVEVGRMLLAWIESIRGRQSAEGRLAWTIVLATIPAGLAGLSLGDFIETHLRSTYVIIATTLIYAPLLLWAERSSKAQRDEYAIGWRLALIIGCAQALALIPGTSRSGITITAALFLGLSRQAAARYSFLMSIPVIFLAGGLETLKLAQATGPVDWQAIGLGTLLAFISAYACIHLFLKLIDRIGMIPFVIYRLLLGFGLLGFVALA